MGLWHSDIDVEVRFVALKPGSQGRHAGVHSSSCGRIFVLTKCTLVSEISFIVSSNKSESNNGQVNSKTY